MKHNILKDGQFYNMIVQTTAGTTDLGPDLVLDTHGFNSVCWIGILDTVTAAGTAEMQHMHSDSTSTTDMVATTAAVAGSTATTTDMDDKLLVLDVHEPEKRYVSVKFDKATQNSETRAIGILYNAHTAPTSQSTDQYGVANSSFVQTPTT